MSITVGAIHETFGGIIDVEHHCVYGPLDVPGAGSLFTQIFPDPRAPDGVRVSGPITPRALDLVTAWVRDRLGLPPLPRAANDNVKQPDDDDTIDGETLLGMTFEPIKYVIPGYVVEGLTILAGKPKLGKSWWAYDAAIAVATGGQAMGTVECEQGDALYLALEDNRRRVKSRLGTLRPCAMQRGINLSRLKIRTRAPRIDTGLLAELEKWRASVAKPRLIIIDVWLKVRPPRKSGADPYAADYDAATPLQRYAQDHRLAIVIVTHTRKMAADDPLESVSGTNGITGVADTVLVLSRGADGVTLYGRGRDVEEIDTVLAFNTGQWTITGDAADVRRSTVRRKMLAAITEAGKPIGPTAIAELAGMKVANVRAMLLRMAKVGEVSRVGDGLYEAGNTGNVGNADPVTSPERPPERDAA